MGEEEPEWMKEINFSIAFCHAFYCRPQRCRRVAVSFPFSVFEGGNRDEGATVGFSGGFPRGAIVKFGPVIVGCGVGGVFLFGVCNLKRFSDSEKLQPHLLLPVCWI